VRPAAASPPDCPTAALWPALTAPPLPRC
jgi:hypothetical protein